MVHTQQCCRRAARSTWTNFKTVMLITATGLLTTSAAMGQTCTPSNPCPAGCTAAFGSVSLDYRACLPQANGGSFSVVIAWPVVAGEQIQYGVRLRKDDPEACNYRLGQLSLNFPNGTLVKVAGYPLETDPPSIPDVATGFSFTIGITPGVASFESTVFTIPAGAAGPLISPVSYGTTGCPVGQQLCGIKRDGPNTRDVSASTSATVNRGVPCINIVKDAINPPPICQGVPTPVLYRYTVTNCSSSNTDGFPLSSIVVVDDNGTPGNPGDDFNPDFISGDTNMNNMLELTETWIYQKTVNVSATTTNTATVNGNFVTPGRTTPVTDNDPATVTAVPRPTCSVTPLSSCVPNQQLTAIGAGGSGMGYTCVWTKDNLPFNPGPSCTINANGPGVYCATISDSNNCSSVSPCCATIFTVPTVQVQGSTVCQGSSGSICATPSGGTPPYTITWFNAANVPVPDSTCSNMMPGDPACCIQVSDLQLYKAIVTDANGCMNMNTGSLSNTGNRLVTVGNVTYCDGSSNQQITANVSGGTAPYTVKWYLAAPGGGCTPLLIQQLGQCTVTTNTGSCSVVPSTLPPVGTSLTYAAVATDANNCVGTGCGTMTINRRPVCSVTPPTSCNTSQTLTATGNTSGPYTCSWTKNNIQIVAPGGSCTLIASGEGEYCATVTDGNGCVSNNPCCATVYRRPVCNVTPQNSCNPSQVLTATGDTCGPYTCTWTKNGLPIAGGANCSLTATGAGNYCATLTDCHGCITVNPCCALVLSGPSVSIDNCPTECVPCPITDGSLTATITGNPEQTVWSVQGPCQITSPLNGNSITYTLNAAEGSCTFKVRVSTEGCPPDEDTCTINCCVIEVEGCRVTGGGNSRSIDYALHPAGGTNRYTHGGQAGAPNAQPPQPHGEWTHRQHDGPAGKWTFHAGTSSAPPGTEISLIECCDTPACPHAAANGAHKQISFEGVGTFRNVHRSDFNVVTSANGRTFHWFTVHIEDLGEPGSPNIPPGANCPLLPNGAECGFADCACPDFYRITIYKGFVPNPRPTNQNPDIPVNQINKVDKVYEVYGYTEGGNLQIHVEVGQPNPNHGAGGFFSADFNEDGRVDFKDLQKVLKNWGGDGQGDLDGDGVIGPADLNALLMQWGQVQ